MKTVAILGEGAWGTAVATVLAHNGHTVHLWCHDPLVVDTIANKKENVRYLPGITLDTAIIPTADMAHALSDTQWIFVTTPVPFLRSVLIQAFSLKTSTCTWVLLSKGIEQETHLLPTQILQEIAQKKGFAANYAVLSGPSFAHDLARKQLTGVVIASPDKMIISELDALVNNDYFRTEVSADVIGVQAGGALKNVAALIMGIFQGMGCADNTKALAFVRCYHELIMLGCAMGGEVETFFDLAGLGDLALSAISEQGRNRKFGAAIGSGVAVSVLLKKNELHPEGFNTIASVLSLINQYDLELPLLEAACAVVSGKQKPQYLLQMLSEL